MNALVPVSEIMTRNIIALNRSDDLVQAEKLFKRYNIRHIPVVQENYVLGMLSYSDLLKISFADATDDEQDVETIVYNMFTIDQVMTKDVVSVESKTSIKEVARILAENEFHALPVVDDGSLVGIVTSTDLIQYLLKKL